MTTPPLPPLPPVEKEWCEDSHMYVQPVVPKYGSYEMREYAHQARADLEAENKRLREALKLLHQASLTQNAWAHGLSAEYVRDTTRATLKEQP